MPVRSVTVDAARLEGLRKNAGLTQVQAAARAGVGSRTWSEAAAGRPVAARSARRMALGLVGDIERRLRLAELRSAAEVEAADVGA